MVYLSDTNKSLFISLAQKLIVIANARYRDENKFLFEIANFLGQLDLLFSLEENNKIGDAVIPIIENLEYNSLTDLSDVISSLHYELCSAAIYGIIKEEIIPYGDFEFDDLIKAHKANYDLGIDINVLIYLIGKLMVHLVALYSKDGILDLKIQAVEKLKILTQIRYFTPMTFESGEELEKLINIVQVDLDSLSNPSSDTAGATESEKAEE